MYPGASQPRCQIWSFFLCAHARNLPSSSWLYFCLDLKALLFYCRFQLKGKMHVHLCCREELISYQREIEVLSEQYSQKCLENAHLAQALEAERQALRQCQRENQELNAHNQVTSDNFTDKSFLQMCNKLPLTCISFILIN